MGWVDSPKFFCAFSERMKDSANALVDTELPVPDYGFIAKIPSTGPASLYTLDSLNNIYFYMDDIVSKVQVGPEQQHQVFDCTVFSLKWLFPSLPVESKHSVSVETILTGQSNWTCDKEVMGYFIIHITFKGLSV